MASVYSWLRLMVAPDTGLLPAAAPPPFLLAPLLAPVLELVLVLGSVVEHERPASSSSSPSASQRRSLGRIDQLCPRPQATSRNEAKQGVGATSYSPARLLLRALPRSCPV